MTAGRKPKIDRDPKVSKIGKEQEAQREVNTPAYDKRDFLCPDFLKGAARQKWTELVELIVSMKNSPITDADKDQMILYCNAWADYEYFDEQIKAKPDLYLLMAKPNKDGEKVYVHVKNLNYDKRKQAADTITKSGERLCIDPVSRAKVGLARVAADKGSAADMLNKLLNRKGDND